MHRTSIRNHSKHPAVALLAVAFGMISTVSLLAQNLDLSKTPVRKTLNRSVALADYGGNKIYIVDKQGDIIWDYPARNPQDVWVLPSGNILFSHVGGATEVTRDKKVVWDYKVPGTSEVHACQPLPDGVVLVAESGPMQLLEIDRDGKILKTVKLKSSETHKHRQMRCVRKQPNGNYIVGQYVEGVLREYDPEGNVVREWDHPEPFSGIRLPNGNLLGACGDAHRIIEFDNDGNIVWEIKENDLPGNPLRFVAGLYRLPNGNTLICNWGGHGHVGEQPQVIEITPDKKVVGELYDFHNMSTIAGVYDMEEERDPTNFEVTR